MAMDDMEEEHQDKEIAKKSEPNDRVTNDSSKNLIKIA
jgi:hypothetical protein